MRNGMLWFDDHTGFPLADKVARATAHYESRIGQRPTVCRINPLDAIAAGLHGPAVIGGLQITADSRVLANHFWLGDPVQESQETA